MAKKKAQVKKLVLHEVLFHLHAMPVFATQYLPANALPTEWNRLACTVLSHFEYSCFFILSI